MTMQAPSFFASMIPSAVTPLVQTAGSFESPSPSATQVHPPSSSVSAPPQSSSSLVAMPSSTIADAITTSGGPGRDLLAEDFYCSSSTATVASRHSVTASDSCGGGGSRLHPLMPTYGVMTSRTAALSCFSTGTASYSSAAGLESLFSGGCGGDSFTRALHYASTTTPAAPNDPPQQASGHLMATGGVAGDGGSAAITAGSPYFGAFGTSTAMTPGSGGLYSQTDTLQPMVYRRSFTSAKPPYSYISLITMAIQV